MALTAHRLGSDSLAFRRREDHRLLLGVAGGFADQHGVDPLVVRGALVVLSFAGGLGIVLYALGAVLASADDARLADTHPPDPLRNAAVGAVSFGACLVVRSTGLWLGDAIMAPLAIVVTGIVVLGVVRPESMQHPGLAAPMADLVSGRHARARVVTGAALVSLGLVMVGASGGVSRSLQVGVFATAVTILGVGVLLGPWLARTAQQAAEERRERIRVQEREAMAAHLHDSVLQTLALIQRTADDPRQTVTLARQQERELRAWLYGTRSSQAESIDAAVRAVAAEIEAAYHVRIEVIVVGDRAMDDDLVSFVAAAREACINAAKHSGETNMAVYVEATETEVEAFVRDRGRGFDRGELSPDRQGIAQSIEARLARLGGSVTIESAPGEGTEVHLVLPGRVGVTGREL